MEQPKPEFNMKREILRIGGSYYLSLPRDLREYLGIEYDDEGAPKTKLSMMPDISKHGRFIGIWNPEQQQK